jgi:hypothetical protein
LVTSPGQFSTFSVLIAHIGRLKELIAQKEEYLCFSMNVL